MKILKYLLALPLFALCIGCPAQTATPNALATLIVTAAAQPATMTIAPTTSTVQTGASQAYAIKVSGPAGSAVPTGTVQLYNGNVLVQGASATLVNGAATCTLTTNGVVPGSYNISAVFTSADNNYTSGVAPK